MEVQVVWEQSTWMNMEFPAMMNVMQSGIKFWMK